MPSAIPCWGGVEGRWKRGLGGAQQRDDVQRAQIAAGKLQLNTGRKGIHREGGTEAQRWGGNKSFLAKLETRFAMTLHPALKLALI